MAKRDLLVVGAVALAIWSYRGRGAAPHPAHHQHVIAELAPLQDAVGDQWHASPSEEPACAPKVAPAAFAVAAAPAPHGVDAARWTTERRELDAAAIALQLACAQPGRPTVAPAFARLHAAFHALLGMTGGHHEGDGAHEHRM